MSTKEFLEKTQPVFYRILNRSFGAMQMSHAYLLVGDNVDVPAIYLAQSLVCKEDVLACETCDDCVRIKEGLYPDLIMLNGDDSSIKKGDIDHLQEEFNKSALEGKEKIYILKNVENSSNVAMNSLLKFLEEPVEGVYAILTTRNLNKVLPTIQTRCQVIQLMPESKESVRLSLLEGGIDEEDAAVLSQLFGSRQECEPYYETELYQDLKVYALNFVEDLYKAPGNLIINMQINLGKKYKNDKEVLKTFLNMLVLVMRDLFHVKHSVDPIFSKHKDFFDNLPEDDRILERIEIVLEALYNVDMNANQSLLIDGMCYKVLKGVK